MRKTLTSQTSSLSLLIERGHTAHPQLRIDDAVFAAHLSRCARKVPLDGGGPPDIFVEDLYLACACVERVKGAAEAFRRRYRQTMRKALAKLSVTPGFRDEVEQQLYESILVGRAGGSPSIADYAGRGPLGRWVAVVAQRTALGMLRAEAAQARARDSAALETVQASIHGEVAYLKAEYRVAVDEALVAVLAELDRRDRVVLHLHLVGGAGVKKIGKMYGVNHSTVSRWLAQTREEIVEKTRSRLRTRLGLGASEIDSVMALVASQLDISVSALLA